MTRLPHPLDIVLMKLEAITDPNKRAAARSAVSTTFYAHGKTEATYHADKIVEAWEDLTILRSLNAAR